MPNRLLSILRSSAITFFVAVVPQTFADDPLPDPRALLSGVEHDRLAIASGRMRLELTLATAERPHETARTRTVLVFDGERRMVDEDRRSLMIDWIRGNLSSITEKRNRLFASWGAPEKIVLERFGYWLDRHSRSISNGKAVMKYSPGSLAGGRRTMAMHP